MIQQLFDFCSLVFATNHFSLSSLIKTSVDLRGIRREVVTAWERNVSQSTMTNLMALSYFGLLARSLLSTLFCRAQVPHQVDR